MSPWSQECVGFEIIGHSPLPYFLSGVLSIVGLSGIAFKLWNSDNMARLGSKSINLILPIYTMPVAYVVVVGITVSFTNILGMYSTSIAIAAAKWLLYRVAADGLAIFLMHNGIGVRALERSLALGTLWAITSATVPLVLYFSLSLEAYSKTAIAFLSLLISGYLFLYFAPARWIHRRPAMATLSLCNALICFVFLLTHVLLLQGSGTASCVVETAASLCWLVQPFVILHALRQDSLFWQGLYVYRGSSPQGGAALNQPLLGMWDIGRTTMDLVLDSLATLERKVVPVIPFGCLELDNSRFFSGGTARVYRGTFGARGVAIKMLFCLELTPERVQSFCAEATLLNSLQHPNVVECIGVSIMPPAICLVTEFCAFGSLYDFLHSSPYIVAETRARGDTDGTDKAGDQESADGEGRGPRQSDKFATSSSGQSFRSSQYAVSFSQSVLQFLGSPEARALSGDRGDRSGADARLRSGSGSGLASVLGSMGFGLGSGSGLGLPALAAEGGAGEAARDRLLWEGVEYEVVPGGSAGPARGARQGGAINPLVLERDRAESRGESRHSRRSLLSIDLPLILEEEEEWRDWRDAPGGAGSDEGEGRGKEPGDGAEEQPEQHDVEMGGTRAKTASESFEGSSSSSVMGDMASTLAAAVQGGRGLAANGPTNNGSASRALSSSSHQLSLAPRGEADAEAGEVSLACNAAAGPASAAAKSRAADKTDKTGSGSTGGAFSVRMPPAKVKAKEKAAAGGTGGGMGGGGAGSSGALTPSRGRMRYLSAVMSSPAFGYGLGPVADAAEARDHRSHTADAHRDGPRNKERSPRPTPEGYDPLGGSAHLQDASSTSLRPRAPSSQSLRTFLASRSAASLSLQQVEPSWQELHLPMSLRIRLCRDAAAGVAYLHASGIMHCDIKSLNFLVDADLVLKLADLGEARTTDEGLLGDRLEARASAASGLSHQSYLSHRSGKSGLSHHAALRAQAAQDARLFPQNINWSAPEVMQTALPTPAASVLAAEGREGRELSDDSVSLSGSVDASADLASPRSPRISCSSVPARERIGPAADVWSLAMVMAEILTGEVPFDSPEYQRMTIDEFHEALQAGARPVFPAWVEGQVPWLTVLIRRAWCHSAAERCGSVDLVALIDEQMLRL